MTIGSPKDPSWRAGFPRGLSSIGTVVVTLAIFLTFASLLLASYPFGSTVREYFYGVGIQTGQVSSLPPQLHQSDGQNSTDTKTVENCLSSVVGRGDQTREVSITEPHLAQSNCQNSTDTKAVAGARGDRDGSDFGQSKNQDMIGKNTYPKPAEPKESNKSKHEEKASVDHTNRSKSMESFASSGAAGVINIDNAGAAQSVPTQQGEPSKSDSVDSGCNLYKGQWVYDSTGPLYTNNTCPTLTQMQNCQGNGRPDKDYENWRWKPYDCDLPRFDGRKFLELMGRKSLAFIGDSVARNQMESMMCILLQTETPVNTGNRRMQRWLFRSTRTTIIRIWSSWLVDITSEKFDYAPEGVTKLHLDAPDKNLMELIPKFDVVVLSSGHWFAKQSVYILNNEIVGGQLWWPDESRPMKINNIEAFGISVETILTSVAAQLNYTGLVIVRSYSPDHYEGGAWNTGGSCTGKVSPATELVENGFTNIMHEKQAQGFNNAIKKTGGQAKLRFMDITEAFSYRHDGHPGPYRNPDPNKLTKRGPDGKPPPQDCLHWCMPGPVDTWNELVFETIRREFEGSRSKSSS